MSEDLAELFDALGGAELAEPPKKSRARSGFIWAGIAALLFLLFSKRKAIMTGAKALAFKATVPKDAGPYADVILRVAEEENLSPFLLYAIGARESGWGSYLTPKGPGGTGDYGHGRGLMQIDDRSNQAWLAANDWRDPLVNLRRGVSILKGKMRFLANNFPVPGLTDGKTVTISEKAAAPKRKFMTTPATITAIRCFLLLWKKARFLTVPATRSLAGISASCSPNSRTKPPNGIALIE